MELRINGEMRRFENAPTVAALLRALELRVERVAVQVNRSVVPRAQHGDWQLAPGDDVEIVTFVGGG
jgi:sulfur carrier protein